LQNNPAIFYNFAKELWPGAHQPTVAHRFIRLLEQKGKLLRNFTQNIDALETRAGIQRVLQCHGSFAAARCMSCRRQFPGKALHADIMQQRIPQCPSCHPPDADHTFDSIDDIGEDGLDRSCKTFGVIKPEITFFGQCKEQLQ
jgi:NAD-dependent histone deacetylase SIR2